MLVRVLCCQAKKLTCGNSDSATPDVKFQCPAGYKYKEGADDQPASQDNCCVQEVGQQPASDEPLLVCALSRLLELY